MSTEIRKLAGLQEAPMDIDPVKIMAQRLDQLEKTLAAYDPEKFKNIMMENLKAIQKLEVFVLLLDFPSLCF